MKALVTGGGGFLGRYIVEQLLERGDEVVSISRRTYPELEGIGARCVAADLADDAALCRACEGVDTVFHVAALAAFWGKYDSFYQTNVVGTRNLLKACRAQGVTRLVYTSSPSVVFAMDDIVGGTERLPYPTHYFAHYPATKAIAEQEVLAASGDGDVLTCSLRPHLIYGPRDTHIVPMLIQRARQGRLIQVGDGSNEVDVTYVENGARAHLQAADALAPGSPVAGQAYFISDGQPVNLWGFVRNLLGQLGEPLPRKQISYRTASNLAACLETVHKLLPFLGEPRLTRFAAGNFAQSHWFSLDKARRDFGYEAAVPQTEGIERTVAWFTAHPVEAI